MSIRHLPLRRHSMSDPHELWLLELQTGNFLIIFGISLTFTYFLVLKMKTVTFVRATVSAKMLKT